MSDYSSGYFINSSFTNTTNEILAFKSVAILVCVSVGIPLNALIALVIITTEHLHKPRHIFWLGVIFSNLFALVTSLIEFIALYGSSRGFCTVFLLLVGISYTSLLLNSFLALIDRFIAITFPIWHKDHVTLRLVLGAQFVGLILTSFLFKTAHLIEMDLLDIPCDENQPHGRIIVFTLLTLVLLCVIAQIVVYLKARKYFNQQRNGNPSTAVTFEETILAAAQSEALQSAAPTQEETTFSSGRLGEHTSPELRDNRNSSLSIHVDAETISKLEVEAAWTLVIGAFSLILISSPISVVLVTSLSCEHSSYNDCTSVTWLIPYFRELILTHTVYNPVVYFYRCREFKDALKVKLDLLCCSLKCCCCCQKTTHHAMNAAELTHL